MKKKLLIILFISFVIILYKFYFSNYEISYNLNNYDIYTKYNNNRYYFEIKDNNITYNFDVYEKRKLSKVFINNIKKIEINDYDCIVPSIKTLDSYPLCYDKKNDFQIDYNLIDSELLDDYKINTSIIEKPNKDFIYYNNLNKNEYIALWTYNGYIIMNDKKYNIVKLFNKDKYDNTLAYIIDDTIYMPNYDQEYEYNSLIALNIVNQKSAKLNLNYSIDYDSYIVGNIKSKLYIFDNKSAILYEINTKNGETKIFSSNEKGYVKYENNKFVKCSKQEYKVDKIKFNNNDSIYTYEYKNGTLKYLKYNKNIKTKINNKEIINIFENNNNLYYILDNYCYLYNPKDGNSKVFYNYELSFNNANTVFMYIK